jgi:hypothetical protein
LESPKQRGVRTAHATRLRSEKACSIFALAEDKCALASTAHFSSSSSFGKFFDKGSPLPGVCSER